MSPWLYRGMARAHTPINDKHSVACTQARMLEDVLPRVGKIIVTTPHVSVSTSGHELMFVCCQFRFS